RRSSDLVGKMPKYVTESGYEEAEDVRTRVGRNPPLGQALKLVGLADGSVRDLPLSSLPGIDRDPLAALRKQAGQPALEGERRVRIEAIQWSVESGEVALMARAVDNKDRWIATVDVDAARLQPAHRLT